MANMSIKINLRQLKSTIKPFKKQDGSKVDCLVIPIDDNHLFKGEKGIYVDLAGFEIKNKVGDSKDTHLIKQSLPKEVYEKMNDQQRRAMPILGNAIVWARQEPAPVNTNLDTTGENDDLPF